MLGMRMRVWRQKPVFWPLLSERAATSNGNLASFLRGIPKATLKLTCIFHHIAMRFAQYLGRIFPARRKIADFWA